MVGSQPRKPVGVACEHEECVTRHWASEMIALKQPATEIEQRRNLLLALDPFGQNSNVEPRSQFHERAADRAAVPAVLNIRHKAAVDLEFVERQLLEVDQARIAGSEIVDGQLYATLAQLGE